MAVGDDVYATLRCSEVDQGELEEPLSFFYGSGHHLSANEITHNRKGAGVALRALYNNDGRLQKVFVGPDALPDDVEQLRSKIEAELLSDAKPRVRRQVLFAAARTTGHFKYKDQFQILPPPPAAPRPDQFIGQHPFILEYAVRTSQNFVITNLRQAKIARELELILSTLLIFRVSGLGSELRKHWVVDYKGDQAIHRSHFLQEGYVWDGAIAECEDFSATGDTPPMPTVEINEYYGFLGLDFDRTLDLPDNFTRQLDQFHGLNAVEREKFLRASYWFQHASTVFTYSKSASFVALVSAIEVIMPEQEAGQKCPECNSNIGPGLTQRFVEFVESLIPGSEISEKDRRRFYRTRSALSHGGKLLAADHGSWGFTPKKLGEDIDARTMWRIVQVVLHNWLVNK
jgi:hypothetical protein